MSKLYFNFLARKNLSNITPFTYKDGITYLGILQELISKVNGEIITVVNDLD